MTEYFGEEFRDECRQLRNEVFMDEQGFDYDADEYDYNCYHACLYDNGVAVAVGRVFALDEEKKDYKLGRIAVKKSYRGTGVGREIIALMEKNINLLGGTKCIISAQVRAQGFYEKVGYTPTGDIYDEDGVPHIKMIKEL